MVVVRIAAHTWVAVLLLRFFIVIHACRTDKDTRSAYVQGRLIHSRHTEWTTDLIFQLDDLRADQCIMSPFEKLAIILLVSRSVKRNKKKRL